MTRLPYHAKLNEYEQQAQLLLDSFHAGDLQAIDLVHRFQPRYRNPDIRWLPVEISDEEIRASSFDLGDARLTLAIWYCFRDWAALEQFAQSIEIDPKVRNFEAAVEAVIAGDLDALNSLLLANPALANARSTRICCFDPPEHHATLLHYVAANGVEGHRQKTPANAAEVTRALLDAGADPNPLADLYGGGASVLCMLISSSHPKDAGVRPQLLELLLDRGASVGACVREKCGSPLMTAVVFGASDCAEVLLRRGTTVDNLALAAGIGQVEATRQFLANADGVARHKALALSAQNGHVECVRLLLDAGEDPNRYNPEGTHAHSTPLHQAAAGGHVRVAQLLVERGARIDIKDKIWNGTPLGWAKHCDQPAIAEYLRAQGPSN